MKYLGPSAYIDTSQVQSVISYCQAKKLASVRYSSRPDSSRAFNQSIVNALTAQNIKVIIEPSHYYLTTNGRFDINKISQYYVDNWIAIKNNFESIVSANKNNQYVAYEGINEYSFSDIANLHQQLINIVRKYSDQDYIATWWEQPFKKLSDSTENTYEGFHRYANYGTLSGYQSRIQNLISAGIPADRICNTEVGAHSSEASYFTQSLVDELNGFLDYNKDVSNMVWMYQGVQNAATYDKYNLVWPWASQTDVTPAPEPEPEPQPDIVASGCTLKWLMGE